MKPSVLRHETSLRTNIRKARIARFRLHPIDATLRVHELSVRLLTIPDQDHLKGVEQIRLLVEVAHVAPGNHKDRLCREIASIVEPLADQLSSGNGTKVVAHYLDSEIHRNNNKLPPIDVLGILGLEVGDGAPLVCRVDVGVERGNGRILDGKGKVDKVRVLSAEC